MRTNTAIKLTTGNFVSNDIYEFSYTAKNPTVNGLGLAAIRDFNSFLRYATVRRYRYAESACGRRHAGSIRKRRHSQAGR